MSFSRSFWNGVARALAFALVAAVLAFIGMGKAHAQVVGDQGYYASKAAALAACNADMSEALAFSPLGSIDADCMGEGTQGSWKGTSCGGYLSVQGQPGTYGNRGCTASAGSTRGVNGPGSSSYFWPAVVVECSAMPNLTNVSGASPYVCSGECRYEQDSPVSVCLGDGADMFCPAASWKPTGDACEPNDKPPSSYDPDRQVCTTTGGSYQECVKPNGEHCVKAPSGQQLCWTPTSLGERLTADGKLGGNRQPAPSTPPPPSNQVDPTHVTTTTTTIGGATYNTSITTGNGSKPGQPNTGVPGDEDGDGKVDDGKGGEGDGEEGTASGGQGCNSPPVATGDPLLVAVIQQQWLTRCAGDSDDNGQPDWTQVEGDGTGGAGEDPESPHRNVSLGIGMLDQNGFGLSRSCPVLGTLDLGMFGAVNLDEVSWLCDFCNAVKVILSMVGAFVAFRILAGR